MNIEIIKKQFINDNYGIRKMKQQNKILGEGLIIVGFILIVVKAIDYFAFGESLMHGLTLIGLILVVAGISITKKSKKKRS